MSSLYPGRWRALDVFRGLVIASMLLVNAADLSGHAYAWLQHAGWEGYGFADAIFPAFLFIMGVPMGVSMLRHGPSSENARHVYTRIVRRSLFLFALGLLVNGLFASGLEDLRIMGVLQRLALCYLFAALIVLHVPARLHLACAALLLLVHTCLLTFVPIEMLPDDPSGIANNLSAYLDRYLLGSSHLLIHAPYLGRLDPEGLLGTLSALANVLLGAVTGRMLAQADISSRVSRRLAAIGLSGWLSGLALSLVIPINKALWSSSFVFVTAGISACALALCYQVVDVMGFDVPTRPFEIMGRNAITAYLLSELLNAAVIRIQVQRGDDTVPLYEVILSATGLASSHAALLFALVQVALVFGCTLLLHQRGLYLRL
jgi:predicted acyltransferase